MSYPTYTIFLNNLTGSPKENWITDFSQLVSEEFYNSSDWYTIKEETSIGSEIYQDVDVRVNYVFNPTTGANLGDDWKILMFSDISKVVDLGSLFMFDDNYWIAVNTENKKNLTSTCIVRRCNNSLRWLGESGELYTAPCILGYEITENRNYATALSAMVNPSGMLPVIAQLNTKTNKIRPNQRFLFGNSDSWIGYKVQGGGINNFNNKKTLINSNNGFLKLTLSVDMINNDTDDLVNGIADINEQVYSISVYGATTGLVGETSQLTATVYLNGKSVSRTVEWSSDDETIATVSSTGLITFVGEGTATIRAGLDDNANVYEDVPIETVIVTPNVYTIEISPNQNYVLEDDTKIFTVSLYLDGVLQGDTFVFTLIPNTVPSVNYTFTAIDGNSFSIKNIDKFLTDVISVQCVSGIHSRTIDFDLRGAW